MRKIYILSPFENKMAKRGTRHPVLAELLVESGHKVEYLTTNFSHARKEYFDQQEVEYFQAKLPYSLTLINIPAYYNNISVKRIFVHQVLAIKYFNYLITKVNADDILILPSRPPELIFAVSMVKRIKKCKIVLDIRDIWPDSLKTSSRIKNQFFKWYCNFFQHRALPIFDKFIHVAPSFQKWLYHYVPNKQSIFIPLGFDKARWNEFDSIEKDFSSDVIQIVYVGQLQYVISLEEIITALNNLEEYFLTIIGDGENLEQLKNLVQEIGMRNIRFTGYISYNEVVEELKSKHIGVLPMRGPAMPNKLFDYIASCLPVLVLGENDASRFIVQSGFGWEKPFDAEVLLSFFEDLGEEDISLFTLNLKSSRDLFSKELLYKKYIEHILNN